MVDCASTVMPSVLAQPADSELDLSDAQIELLLSRASQRLQVKEEALGKARAHDARLRIPKLGTDGPLQFALDNPEGKSTLGGQHSNKQIGFGIRKVEDPVQAKRLAKEKKEATAGGKWFDLPKTNLTPELKRDLQLLKMRGVLDPHRHYKKENGKMEVPEYSQVGTIVEGAAEFFGGRIENKKRKRTFVEEVLAGEQETGRFKRKYGELQAKRSSGKKGFYKALQSKRKSGIKKGG